MKKQRGTEFYQYSFALDSATSLICGLECVHKFAIKPTVAGVLAAAIHALYKCSPSEELADQILLSLRENAITMVKKYNNKKRKEPHNERNTVSNN
jgi:hypothetical protein